MTESSPDDKVLIWSGEHRMWWRPEGKGYSQDIHHAGIYTRVEAEDYTSHCGPEKMINIIPLEEALQEHVHQNPDYDEGTVGAFLEEQEEEHPYPVAAYEPVGGPIKEGHLLLEYSDGDRGIVEFRGKSIWGAIGVDSGEGDYLTYGEE